MDVLRIMIFIFIRTLMRVFCLFPIKRNRILFESYKGRSYSCNPKYLCEYLMKNTPGRYEMIWVLNEPERVDLPGYIKKVKKKSIENFYYHMTSRFIVVNMTDDVFIPKRKNQIVINTWHAGGAYKKVGLSFETTNSMVNKWQDGIVRKETTYYVTSSELFTKFNIHEAYQYEGMILECGMPRNDLFFDEGRSVSIKKRVRSQLGLTNKLIVLYAPTFRGDYGNAKNASFVLPFGKIMHLYQTLGRKTVILNRSHYSIGSKGHNVSGMVMDVSDYPDMQELLACADILITDYSSSIWDFALTGKPCVLFVPDREEYLRERGTYTPMEEWPGFMANNEDELLTLLAHLDENRSRKKASESLLRYGSYERGTACQTLAELINEVCNDV